MLFHVDFELEFYSGSARGSNTTIKYIGVNGSVLQNKPKLYSGSRRHRQLVIIALLPHKSLLFFLHCSHKFTHQLVVLLVFWGTALA